MRSWLLIILFIFLLIPKPVCSADWNEVTDLDKAWESPNEFSNQKYDKVIDALEQKKNKQEKKKRKKLFKKISGGGTSLHEELNPDNQIQEIDAFTKKEDLLLNVPVKFVLGDKVLEPGYYKILAERDENKKIVIKFYQSQFFMGSLIANETEEDYEQEKIDFVDIKKFNESFLKLIFGSLDFNAYAYIQYFEK